MTERGKPSRGPDYFLKLYAKNPDPWDFTGSSDEYAKYQMSLAALGEGNFQNAFEIGCSIGILTRMLAPKCRSLLAVDVVDSALATARENCKALNHVRFQNLQIPDDWPSGEKFNLIDCSEVLYYLSPVGKLMSPAAAMRLRKPLYVSAEILSWYKRQLQKTIFVLIF
jgi:predicted TPR repeat methyltransferase